MPMIVRSFTCNPFQTNCYVCHDGQEAVLIDPSSQQPHERKAILSYIEAQVLSIRRLLLTHAHIDHIFDAAFFSDHFDLPVLLHRDEALFLDVADEQARLFGVAFEGAVTRRSFINPGDVVKVGSASLEILHAPGHSPGSICFFEPRERLVISGDVLFSGSIGRTDLWRSSQAELMQSLFQVLLPLGDDVRVFPGHGPATTIGQERRTNPYLRDEG